MKLAIVIRQEVSDLSDAKQKVRHIRDLLSDIPDIEITAQASYELEPTEEPE